MNPFNFQVFWDQYYFPYFDKIPKTLSYWKMIVLSKRFVNDLRETAILNEHDVVLACDFTDAMCVTHNQEHNIQFIYLMVIHHT